VRDLPATIASLSERLSNLTADQSTAAAHINDPITVAGHTYSEEVVVVLGNELDSLPRSVRETRRFPLGLYRGLSFGLILHPQYAPEVYVEGATTRESMLSREHHGPRAVLNALERLAGTYDTQCTSIRQDLAIAEAQLRDYQARLGAPFPHDSYLSKLTALRDQLKTGLSGMTPEPPTEPQPTVSELAQQIKALKATHTIEATPERIGKGRSSAEEPVTARIRRLAERIPQPQEVSVA
jgi:hypothetical protein